jgi:DNA polymerase-3 subunit chi
VTEVGFYQLGGHLGGTALERALPKLLERALAEGYRIVVMAGSPERVDHLDTLLWTYDEASFLPHGSARSGLADGQAAAQPIWLTAIEENPNNAQMLVLTDGVRAAGLALYARCCDMFDGGDEGAVAAARERWRDAKAAGHSLAYWEQTAKGWEKRR